VVLEGIVKLGTDIFVPCDLFSEGGTLTAQTAFGSALRNRAARCPAYPFSVTIISFFDCVRMTTSVMTKEWPAVI
jgi:hypothetical protein